MAVSASSLSCLARASALAFAADLDAAADSALSFWTALCSPYVVSATSTLVSAITLGLSSPRSRSTPPWERLPWALEAFQESLVFRILCLCWYCVSRRWSCNDCRPSFPFWKHSTLMTATLRAFVVCLTSGFLPRRALGWLSASTARRQAFFRRFTQAGFC